MQIFETFAQQCGSIISKCSQSNLDTIRREIEILVSSVPESVTEYFGGQIMEKVSSFTLFEIERAVGKFSWSLKKISLHTRFSFLENSVHILVISLLRISKITLGIAIFRYCCETVVIEDELKLGKRPKLQNFVKTRHVWFR